MTAEQAESVSPAASLCVCVAVVVSWPPAYREWEIPLPRKLSHPEQEQGLMGDLLSGVRRNIRESCQRLRERQMIIEGNWGMG